MCKFDYDTLFAYWLSGFSFDMETRLLPCAEAEFLLSKKLLMPLPILLPSLDLFWLESRPQALLTLNFCRLDDCILA